MLNVVVGVGLTALLTALLGGVLAPVVKEQIDRRRERLDSSVEVVEVLASALWAYWKFALRVAYYGSRGERSTHDYQAALRRWNSDDAWNVGSDVQVQVSRLKRLWPSGAQKWVDEVQGTVIDYLDANIDALCESGTRDDWREFYNALKNEKRDEIDRLLTCLTDPIFSTRSHPRMGLGLTQRSA